MSVIPVPDLYVIPALDAGILQPDIIAGLDAGILQPDVIAALDAGILQPYVIAGLDPAIYCRQRFPGHAGE